MFLVREGGHVPDEGREGGHVPDEGRGPCS